VKKGKEIGNTDSQPQIPECLSLLIVAFPMISDLA